MALVTERQIRHIEEHLEEFNNHQCHLPPYTGNPRAYMLDAEKPDIYERLCSDLDLEPIAPPAVR